MGFDIHNPVRHTFRQVVENLFYGMISDITAYQLTAITRLREFAHSICNSCAFSILEITLPME